MPRVLPLPLRLTVALLLTTGVVAGGACGGGDKGGSILKGTATGAAPTSTSAVAGLPAAELVAALAGVPFLAAELPSGFFAPEVEQGEPGEEAKKYNAKGRVTVSADGPDFYDGIVYNVFATDADAKNYYDTARFQENMRVTGNFAPQGVSAPAKCLTGSVDESGQTYGTTGCLALSGNTVTVGVSVLSNDRQKGNADSSVALLKAALTHLEKVRANPQARATARPAASPTTAVITSTRAATASASPARTPSPTATAVRTASATPARTATINSGETLAGNTLKALENVPFEGRELPAGFFNPQVSSGTLDEQDRRLRAVGQVDVDVEGPDDADLIIYIVFNNDADARNYVNNAAIEGAGTTVTGSFDPAGLASPSKCFTGVSTSGSTKNGISGCLVSSGHVVVFGAAVLAGNTQRGNNQSALNLTKAGVEHLKKVR